MEIRESKYDIRKTGLGYEVFRVQIENEKIVWDEVVCLCRTEGQAGNVIMAFMNQTKWRILEHSKKRVLKELKE